jgi:hypothetical protein
MWADIFACREWPREPHPEDRFHAVTWSSPVDAGGWALWSLGVRRCWQCHTLMGLPPGPCEGCGWLEADETEWNE